MAQQKVLIILGPTASGKSDLGVRLAKKFNGEVISADSRQVYKGLDIGTGKITKREMKGIPHHLLDVVNPRTQFSVSQYKELALNSLQYIVTKNKLPIVVGGTGLYIDTLTGAVNFPDVPPNPILRMKLQKESVKVLYKKLCKKDPERALTIDPHNKVRLIRALEIVEAIGHVPMLTPSVNKNWKFVFIGLKPDKVELEERIRARLIKRLSRMIREGQELHARGLSYKRMYALGLEYRFIALYLQGKISKGDMLEKLNIAIRQYARRQMTWFKRNKKIKWFKPSQTREIDKFLFSL